jgi:serine/threonine protein kinase
MGPLLAPGVSVGGYVILQLVGRGGMGEVYAAFDPELDRKVAIKVIRSTTLPTTDDAAARARLLREARASARLSHPNVVAVFDAGTVDGRVFLAREFVEGRTLAQSLADMPPNIERWRTVLPLFLAAGRGLAAAHAVRIVHRDFNPQNVMVGFDGHVRVMDFTGRPMKGYVYVDPPAITEDGDLKSWVLWCAQYVANLPGKQAKAKI